MNELDLFIAANAITDSEERAAFLDRECAGNSPLRQRLEALLAGNEQSEHPLDSAAMAGTGSFHEPKPLEGQVIAGKYTLVEMVGEGGMGSVWRAKQSEPVKRFVAVKLIKAGMDTKQVLARFEAERQALALMDHPNIAKVLDGGIHEGRPFFVMELVKGVPISEYCDDQKLTPRERLELFVPVCNAIQHAHQKGIIHRDIKPTNVLVALYDDKPVVKVIDFGVAKATGGALTEATIDTAFGGVVGTPQYMSPEQATFNNLDIDTRSDVYALGVLLYELLTGSTPFSRKDLEKKGLMEILRVVREEEPPRPSTKLSTADALPSISANRATEPKTLTRLLRNELDWIVMKALAKDRTRRYQTANGFAADVLRYLSGEPVQAVPPSAGYRLKKLVRRNKGKVTAAGLVLLTLLVGIAGTSWGFYRESLRAEGERNAKQEALEANAQTKKRLAQIEKGVELFAGMLRGINPRAEEQGGEPLYVQLRKRAEKAADALDAEAVGDPLAVARLQSILGDTLLELGSAAKAEEVLEKARTIRERTLGADHPDTLATLNDLASKYWLAGRVSDAIALHEKIRDMRVKKLGADHPDTLTTLNNLAVAYYSAGNISSAIALHEQIRDARMRTLGADHNDTLTTLHNLATAYYVAGRVPKAIALHEQVRDVRVKKLGANHADTLTTLNNLATAYHAAGRVAEAISLLELVRDLRVKKLGADDPNTITTLVNLARAYRAAAKLPEAVAVFEQAASGVAKRRFQHVHADGIIHDTSAAFEQAGRLDKAEGWRRKWLAIVKERSGTDSTAYAGELDALGLNLLQQQKWAEAETALKESLAIRAKLQPNTWTTFNTQSMLGGALLGQKKYKEAEPLLLKGYQGLKACEKTIPPQASTRIPEAVDRLIELYTVINKPDEVKKWKAERAKYPVETNAPPAPVKNQPTKK